MKRTDPKLPKSDYGMEAIYTFHNVKDKKFFLVENVKKLANDLVKDAGMEEGPNISWPSSGGVRQENEDKYEKARGVSVCQFLQQSSCVIHALDEEHKVFINLFCCQKFNAQKIKAFLIKNIPGDLVQEKVIIRP